MATPFEWVIGLSALFGVGAAAYQMSQGGVNVPAPPTPANAYQYNSDGTVTVQRWDEDRNGYVTEHDPEPDIAPGQKPKEFQEWLKDRPSPIPGTGRGLGRELGDIGSDYKNYLTRFEGDESTIKWQEWKLRQDTRDADRELRAKLKKDNLDFLDAPGEERVALYEKYATTYTQTLKDEILPELDKRSQAIDQQAEKTGVTGSSFHAQLKKDHAELAVKTETSIEQAGILQAKDFEQADKTTSLNVLNYLEGAGSAEHAQRLQDAGLAATSAGAGNAVLRANYEADLAKGMFAQERSVNLAQMGMDTASGAAFLYGFNRPGKSSISPGSGAGSYINTVNNGSTPYSRILNPSLRSNPGTSYSF